MRELWTTHTAKWSNLRKEGIHLLDTTRQRGDGTFAPSWDLLMAYKKGHITWNEYHRRYTQEMRESYERDPEVWSRLLNLPKVALGCVCSRHDNCHRKILRNIVIQLYLKNDIPYVEKGEYI